MALQLCQLGTVLTLTVLAAGDSYRVRAIVPGLGVEERLATEQRRYQRRAGIEGTLSQGVRGFGLQRLVN